MWDVNDVKEMIVAIKEANEIISGEVIKLNFESLTFL